MEVYMCAYFYNVVCLCVRKIVCVCGGGGNHENKLFDLPLLQVWSECRVLVHNLLASSRNVAILDKLKKTGEG